MSSFLFLLVGAFRLVMWLNALSVGGCHVYMRMCVL